MARRLCPGVLAFAVLILGGCAAPPPSGAASATSANAASPPAPRRVALANLTSRTAPEGEVGLTVAQFAAQAAQWQTSGKLGRLQRFVARFPDVALQMLRETSPSMALDPERQAVGQAYDALFVAAPATSGWSFVLVTTAMHPDEQQAQYQGRARVRSFIEQGRLDVAAKLDVGPVAGMPPFLRADLLRLRGSAWFLEDQFEQALAAWHQSLALADSDACAAAELELLISEAQRRLGRSAESAAAWSAAAERAMQAADPALWQRLLDCKPDGVSWSATVQSHFRQILATSPERASAEDFDDGFIWTAVAEWRLERAEPVAALLAFAHAESTCASARMKGEARIGQARALLNSGQSGPALTILATASQAQESSVARHALAVMGVAYLQQGRSDDGIKLLQRAVEVGDSTPWSDDLRAQVDLGAAYLAAGREEDGLKLLHDGQAAFRRDGRVSDLCQCLANEVVYLQRKGQSDRLRAALGELSQLEDQAQLPR